MRVLAVISSAALILSGVWCFANFGVSFMGMAFIIGLVLVFAGLVGVLVFMKTDFGNRVVKDSLNWFLAETIVFFILGVVILSNRLVGDSAIQFVFGLLILYAGIMRVIAYLRRIRGAKYSWLFTLGFGILDVLFGVYIFFNFTTMAIPTVIVVGFLLSLCGVNRMIFAVAMNSFHVNIIRENSVVADLENWEESEDGVQ